MNQPGQGINISECRAFIADNYVNKLRRYLRDEAASVSTHEEFMKVYQVIIYQCDVNDNNQQVCDIQEEFVQCYIREEAKPKLRGIKGERLLENLVSVWGKFVIFAKSIDRAFDYLNRYFLRNSNMPLVGHRCLQIFKEEVYNEMKEHITSAILEQITKDRNHEQIQKEIVRKAIAVFVDIGLVLPKPMRTREGNFVWQGDRNLYVYDEDFEAAFLERTQRESSQKATVWNSTRNCPEYLGDVAAFIENEELNADYWLQPETKLKMLRIVENELITKMADQVSAKDSGVVSMLTQRNKEELKLMFDVFKRDSSTFGLIVQRMNPYILQRGSAIVNDEANMKDPYEFTQKLLDFKAEIDDLVSYSFSNQIGFQKARDNSFTEFMNQQQFTPTYIAQFSDREFRTGLKGISNDDVNRRLSAIIDLFRCLNGRDAFLKQAMKELSQRLLNKTSISSEFEELFIQKLKVECGANQVNNMTQMFKDMQLSKDMQQEFGQIQGGRNLGLDFSVEVLTSGTWPPMDKPACEIPPQMRTCVTRFEQWFKSKNQNRQLTWMNAHGQVELQTTFTQGKKYTLVVNTFQAAILCMFNEGEQYSCSQIKQATHVADEQFTAAMKQLCNPKVKLLLKEVNKPVFGENEKIKVNMAYKSGQVRSNLIPQKVVRKQTTEATAEEQQQAKQIARERTFVVQAHIVKVMKAQKQYRFQNLQTDVMRNITMFKADPKMIKEQIEVLISQDYMKRDERDKANLIYVP